MHILDTFGPVWDAAGLRGFFGEGYWFHRLARFWLSFEGSTFVSKTVTSFPHEGNMPLTEAWTPKELRPRCIYDDWPRGHTINSVGLSGPGIRALAVTGRWQRISEPFFISWMPVKKGFEERVVEAEAFVQEMRYSLGLTSSRQVGIQFNVSCPNVGADYEKLLGEAEHLLSILQMLGLPIVVKLNLLMSPEKARALARHPACAGLCISNTLPFGTLLEERWWQERYPYGSPLERRSESYGKGGLSGPVLFPLVRDWVHHFRRDDPVTYINAGGGVWHKSNVDDLREAGANSVFIGTVAMHRPWRVPGIINRAYEVFSR